MSIVPRLRAGDGVPPATADLEVHLLGSHGHEPERVPVPGGVQVAVVVRAVLRALRVQQGAAARAIVSAGRVGSVFSADIGTSSGQSGAAPRALVGTQTLPAPAPQAGTVQTRTACCAPSTTSSATSLRPASTSWSPTAPSSTCHGAQPRTARLDRFAGWGPTRPAERGRHGRRRPGRPAARRHAPGARASSASGASWPVTTAARPDDDEDRPATVPPRTDRARASAPAPGASTSLPPPAARGAGRPARPGGARPRSPPTVGSYGRVVLEGDLAGRPRDPGVRDPGRRQRGADRRPPSTRSVEPGATMTTTSGSRGHDLRDRCDRRGEQSVHVVGGPGDSARRARRCRVSARRRRAWSDGSGRTVGLWTVHPALGVPAGMVVRMSSFGDRARRWFRGPARPAPARSVAPIPTDDEELHDRVAEAPGQGGWGSRSRRPTCRRRSRPPASRPG